MIYLSNDTKEVFSVLRMNFGNTAIRNIVELYLSSYGTQFDFAQFYIQTNDNSNTTALIFRYNQTVYCLSDVGCDISELSGFLRGFTDTEVISDALLDADILEQECAVMSTKGRANSVPDINVSLCTEPKLVASLVCEGFGISKETDFFLNTAHQMRHNLLSVYGLIRDNKPVSVASVFENENKEAVIPFVYTSQYFRGNGFSAAVLITLCSNEQVTYRLLCENHNVEFYKKCGFTKESTWYKYLL